MPRTFGDQFMEKIEAAKQARTARENALLHSFGELRPDGPVTVVDVLIEMLGRIEDAKTLSDFAGFVGERQGLPLLKEHGKLLNDFRYFRAAACTPSFMKSCPCGAPIKFHRSKSCWNCHLEKLKQRPIPRMQSLVFILFLAGRSQKEMAFELHVSEKTVSSHKLQLMKKLAVPNDVELVLAGVRLGYIPGYGLVEPVRAALEPLAA